MRLMKFRGKCTKGEHKGKWVYGGVNSYLATDKSGEQHHRACIIFVNNFRVIGVSPESVGQSLYLKDMNGKDIYEGDIVLWNSQKYQVAWCRDKACFALKDKNGLYNFNWTNSPVEIIGNIIDNPELL